jgi:dihydrofolate reductase
MGRLVFTAITSLDGYVNDASGNFDWAAPDADVHAFVNDLERPVGTYLLGRRMYEVLRVWETLDDPHPVMRDYADVWRAADKVVYSRTLETADTARTRLEREFDATAVAALKEASAADLSVGGPDLAASALRAGLVDECAVFLTPVVVGGGQHWLPADLRLDLELADEHRFDSGVVYLRYRVKR